MNKVSKVGTVELKASAWHKFEAAFHNLEGREHDAKLFSDEAEKKVSFTKGHFKALLLSVKQFTKAADGLSLAGHVVKVAVKKKKKVAKKVAKAKRKKAKKR